jgi:hypothetical protein
MYRRAPRKRTRHSGRQVLGVVAVGALLGASLFATGEYISLRQRMHTAAAATMAAGANDDELYTGSILFMPNEGRNCHQLLFNNNTGRFTDNGYVDCTNAAYRSAAEPKQWSAARMRVIADGFHDH